MIKLADFVDYTDEEVYSHIEESYQTGQVRQYEILFKESLLACRVLFYGGGYDNDSEENERIARKFVENMST